MPGCYILLKGKVLFGNFSNKLRLTLYFLKNISFIMLNDNKIEIPYIKDPELLNELETRIKEFENHIQERVLKGGDGYVPRIKKRDLIIAAVINIIILVYYIFSLLI